MIRPVPSLLIGALVLFGLYLTSLYSYLLFHALTEIFSVVIACSIFVLAWNSRHIIDNAYLVIIGIAYLFVGGLDLLHTLAYKGMGVFPGHGANLATQLWIATRYLQTSPFLIAPLLMNRKVRYPSVLYAYSAAAALLLFLIFSGLFPDCYLENTGLTPFKKVSEYIISTLFLAAIFLLFRRQEFFDPKALRPLAASLVLTILSELAFTSYFDVYGFFNLLGHYLKVAAFYLFYKATIETALVTPYRLLFRNLKQSEESLRQAHDELEVRVRERTAELSHTIDALRESEKKYSQLVEGSLTGIFIAQDGRIVFSNQRFAAIFGYSQGELEGLESWKLVHPEDRVLMAERREKRLGGEPVPLEYEARGLTKDGRTIWITQRNTRIEYRGRPAILGNCADVTHRKDMEGALRESEKELRLLSSQLLAAQENERKSISRELHDSIGQTLVAIKFSLERKLTQMERDKAPPGLSLEDILSIVQNGIEEIRRIMTNLRPSILDDLGILATLSWFCREFQKVYPHIQVQKEIDIQEEEVPEHLKIVIFRILQEATNNVAKYSGGNHILLSLGKRQGRIELRVEDNGTGFDLESPRKGLGLSSMKERAQLSGGIFTLESYPGKGTCIQVVWPVSQ